MSKDKRKHQQKYQDRYTEFCERLKLAAQQNTDRLYGYHELMEATANAHRIPKTELQENWYGFTKWLSRNHSGKIVYVGLENGTYVIHWRGETKDPVQISSTFDGIPVKCVRVKEGEIII